MKQSILSLFIDATSPRRGFCIASAGDESDAGSAKFTAPGSAAASYSTATDAQTGYIVFTFLIPKIA